MDKNRILQFAGATGMNMEMFVCRSGERNKSLQCRFPVMLFKEIRLLLISLFINHFRRTLLTVKIQAVGKKICRSDRLQILLRPHAVELLTGRFSGSSSDGVIGFCLFGLKRMFCGMIQRKIVSRFAEFEMYMAAGRRRKQVI